MIKFVKSKPLKRINRHTVSESNPKINIFSFKKIPLKLVRITISLLICIYAVILIFKKTAFSQEYTIKNIKYNTSDLQTFSNTGLYGQISNLLKKENFYISRLSKSSILAEIEKEYPAVSDISFSMIGDSTIYVDLDFKEPDLVLKLQDKKYGVYGSKIIGLSSGSKISAGKKTLFLPDYLSGTKVLSGFFYRISPGKLIEQISILASLLPNLEQITYLPGGEKTIIYMPKGQILYFNNLVDIAEQVKYYNLLKSYYKDFAKIKEIDLGSSGKDKVILKKW